MLARPALQPREAQRCVAAPKVRLELALHMAGERVTVTSQLPNQLGEPFTYDLA
jgi:hypothetical protein